MTTDASGDTYLTGGLFTKVLNNTDTPSYVYVAFLTRLNPAGQIVFSRAFGGSGSDRGTALAVDPSGNIYVAGASNSPDLLVTNALQTQLVLDLLLTGTTLSSGIPATPGTPADSVNLLRQGMFITEIDAAGSGILYNGVLAGNATPCPPIPPGAPETCGDITALTSGAAIAVDSSGNAYVAGNTNTTDLPATSGLRRLATADWARGSRRPKVPANFSSSITWRDPSRTDERWVRRKIGAAFILRASALSRPRPPSFAGCRSLVVPAPPQPTELRKPWPAPICHHESMSKAALIALAFACSLRAETHSLTLRQAVELALKQNPDVALARLDEEKSRQGVRLAHGPFTPRVTAGSGLAYSDGFPVSIAGSAPSVAQAVTTLDIFNRQQSLAVAQAKEDARGSAFATANKRDDAAYRVAALFLDAERAARLGELAAKDIENRQRVLAAIQAQVQEGRVLPLAQKQAELAIAQTRQATLDLEDQRESAETSLAVALGFPAEDRVQPAPEQRTAPALPASVDEAVQAALESNKEMRQLQSQSASKQLEIRGDRAARWPRIDLVAQYTMLAKFNNYAEFFNKFQRNNGQIGMSFQLPIFAGGAIGAQVAQAEIDVNHLKLEMANARNRIAADVQQSFRDVTRSQSAADVARLDLDVAREQVSVDLAQMQEGRLPMREMEEARVVENAKWIALYDAQYALEKARWNVLRLTGQFTAGVEQLR